MFLFRRTVPRPSRGDCGVVCSVAHLSVFIRDVPLQGSVSPHSVSVILHCIRRKYGQAVASDRISRLSQILQKAKQVFPFLGDLTNVNSDHLRLSSVDLFFISYYKEREQSHKCVDAPYKLKFVISDPG